MIQNQALVETAVVLRALFALIVGTCLAPGCAAGDTYRPGESDALRSAPNEGVPPPAPPPTQWELASTIPTLKVIQDSFPSRGHKLGAVLARVLANEPAASAVDSLHIGDRMPAGAVLVAQNTSRANGAPDGYFVMVKKEPGYFPAGGDWEWIALDSDRNVRSRGQLAPCARCHADAAVDYVFTWPAPPSPEP